VLTSITKFDQNQRRMILTKYTVGQDFRNIYSLHAPLVKNKPRKWGQEDQMKDVKPCNINTGRQITLNL
jgi:hypothetical protein